MWIPQLAAFLLGLVIVFRTVFSVVQTFVLPRSANDALTGLVFVSMRRLFDLRTRRAQSYTERDNAMAFYAPAALLSLLPVWLVLIWTGYALMYWGAGIDSWYEAFKMSGSALLTLGFDTPNGLAGIGLAFSEAALGLMLVALLIAYLPTMYSAFQRREAAVNLLEVRAGSPPSAVEFIERVHRIGRLDQLPDFWAAWEQWFVDLEESHTSLAALVFFRSPQPDHSWITAAGAVLDAAALFNSTVDTPHNPQLDLTIRAGYLALRRISDFFHIPYEPNPKRDDPISISRVEYDAAYAHLREAGVPLCGDLDKAWADFSGWRVNYDRVLLALAALTMAPYAPWSSDRSLRAANERS